MLAKLIGCKCPNSVKRTRFFAKFSGNPAQRFTYASAFSGWKMLFGSFGRMGRGRRNRKPKNGVKKAFLGLPGFCPGSAQELFSITARNGTSQDETSRFSALQSAVMYGSHAKARHFNSVTITD